MRVALKRVAVQQPVQSRSEVYTFEAPTRGWIVNENLANARKRGAKVLDNWFPTQTSIRIRGGSKKRATISSGAVVSMWTYKASGPERFFAADATNIFDITTVADADVIPTADVTGQTSGYYSTAQIGTAGGDYLYAVNGDDNPQLYDGTSWTAVTAVSSPAITGKDATTFSFVWLFANRLFFVEQGTMNAWYLPVDSVGGAVSQFSLAGVFQKGGSLLFGGTWSLDSGDGLDDKCVFVSDKGEVAIYEGTDPSSASTWSKVGVYAITPPMGMNGTMRAGGDFLIACEDGIVPISQAVQKDVAALSLSAVTRAIEPEWQQEVIDRRSLPWEIVKWPSRNMAIVSLPVPSAQVSERCFVVNMETGAWCRYTNWNTRCMTLYDDFAYFGTNDGKVQQCEVGGNDDGSPYTAAYVGQFDHLKHPAAIKTVHSARTTFTSGVDIDARISVSKDYQISLPSVPNSIAEYTTDNWDEGKWDEAIWDAGQSVETKTKWASIGATGFAIAPQIQITSGVTPKPNAELIAYDVIYETGGVMV